MRRFASLVVIGCAMAGAPALLLAGSGASARSASAASALPTLNLALTGTTGISVSGAEVSGAVNVVSTFSGKGQGGAALVRLNPEEPPGVALAKGFAAVQKAGGDINALTALGDALVFAASAPGTAQTVLTPGAWVALNITGNGAPGFQMFTVTQSGAAAALPTPGGTVKAIEFGFRGANRLHDGELVRFENDGFLAHMFVGIRVKNTAVAAAEIAALKAGNRRLERRLASGLEFFVGTISPGGMQQETITAKPGLWVLACFENAQDHHSHTQLGMERIIKIAK